VLLAELVAVSEAVSAVRARGAKLGELSALLRRLAPDEVDIAIAFLSGELRQGKIGLGWSSLAGIDASAAAAAPSLGLTEVDAAFAAIAGETGKGRARGRERLLGELVTRATAAERDFLKRLVLGELRQGALEGLLLEAVARAAETPSADLRRALLFAGSLRDVARAVLLEGPSALARFSVQLFRPLSPMLAQPAEALSHTLERLSPAAALEYKLDGARVQVHRSGQDVRVYSRSGHDVTEAVPELVALARGLPVSSVVLDGEAIALRADGRPLPFQTTMRRFGRKRGVETLVSELPLSAFFFDCLYLDSEVLVDAPNEQRVGALAERVPAELRVPRLVASELGEAEAFFAKALADGHEGLVAKDLRAAYEAGRRASHWLKLKPARTLDLVVLAVERGSGRRSAWLSNIHLGARDTASGGFAMLGKTFKGMTDEMLIWQTERFKQLSVAHDGHVVHLKPVQVVEVAFDGVQTSSQYASGVALRFARVLRYRSDKTAAEADTLDTVRALLPSA
jgi:DNA ligase-1